MFREFQILTFSMFIRINNQLINFTKSFKRFFFNIVIENKQKIFEKKSKYLNKDKSYMIRHQRLLMFIVQYYFYINQLVKISMLNLQKQQINKNPIEKTDRSSTEKIKLYSWSNQPSELQIFLEGSQQYTQDLIAKINRRQQGCEISLLEKQFEADFQIQDGTKRNVYKVQGKISIFFQQELKKIQILTQFQPSPIKFDEVTIKLIKYRPSPNILQKQIQQKQAIIFNNSQTSDSYRTQFDTQNFKKFLGEKFYLSCKIKKNLMNLNTKYFLPIQEDSVQPFFNSTLQILFFLQPFRKKIMEEESSNKIILIFQAMFKYMTSQTLPTYNVRIGPQAVKEKFSNRLQKKAQIQIQKPFADLGFIISQNSTSEQFLVFCLNHLEKAVSSLQDLWTAQKQIEVIYGLPQKQKKSGENIIVKQRVINIKTQYQKQQYNSLDQALKSFEKWSVKYNQLGVAKTSNQIENNLKSIILPNILFLNLEQTILTHQDYFNQKKKKVNNFQYKQIFNLSHLAKQQQSQQNDYILYAVVSKYGSSDSCYRTLINISNMHEKPFWIQINQRFSIFSQTIVRISSVEGALSFKENKYLREWDFKNQRIKNVQDPNRGTVNSLVYIKKNKFNLLQQQFNLRPKQCDFQGELSNLTQQALVAFMVLKFIREFQYQVYSQVLSIRERLANLAQFKSYMFKQMNKANEGQYYIENEVGMGISRENIQIVLKGFYLNHGAEYCRSVFKQDRIQDSMIRETDQSVTKNVLDNEYVIKKTVLNPTIITRDIINRIYISTDCLITGEKGCGKTFSYLIYNYLSSFILRYRINMNIGEKIKQLEHKFFYNIFTRRGLQNDSFKQVKKIFYFILSNQKVEITWSKLFSNFQFQVVQQIDQKKIQHIKPPTNQIEFAHKIKEILMIYANESELPIKNICIIDEINTYYSNVRKFKRIKNNLETKKQMYRQKNKQDNKDKQLRINKAASGFIKQLQTDKFPKINQNKIQKSNQNFNQKESQIKLIQYQTKSQYQAVVIKILIQNFHKYVLNASQIIQQKQLSKDVEYKLPFHHALNNRPAKSFKLCYNQISNTTNGIIELYTVYWFQISLVFKHFHFKQEIKVFKKNFSQYYGLNRPLNKIQKIFDNTRILDIRNSIRSLLDGTQLKQLIQTLKKYEVIKIPHDILLQMVNIFQLENKRKKEITTSQKNNEGNKDFSIYQRQEIAIIVYTLVSILQLFQENIKLNQFRSLQQSFKEYLQKQLSFQDHQRRLILLFHIRSAALVEYQKQDSEKQSEYLEVSLKDFARKQDYQKYCDNIDLLDIGYITRKKQKKLNIFKILYSPQTIIKASDILFDDSFKVIGNLLDLMSNFTSIMFQGANIGDFFDIFIGRIFKRGDIKFNIISENDNIVSFKPLAGDSIESWNHKLYLRETFLQFFKKALANPGKGFCAAPTDRTNQAFDAIHVIKKPDFFQITTFDATISPFSSKFSVKSNRIMFECISNFISLVQKINLNNINSQHAINQFDLLMRKQNTVQDLIIKILQVLRIQEQNKSQMRQHLEKILKKGGYSKIKTLQILMDVVKYPIQWFHFQLETRFKLLKYHSLFSIYRRLLWSRQLSDNKDQYQFNNISRIIWKHYFLRPKPRYGKKLIFQQAQPFVYILQINRKLTIQISLNQAYLDMQNLQFVKSGQYLSDRIIKQFGQTIMNMLEKYNPGEYRQY